MAWTSVLGSSDSILGLSFRLGAATESGGPDEHDVAATNTISLTQTGTENLVQEKSASSTLSLSQSVGLPVFEVDAASSVTLTQAASGSSGVLQNSEISPLTLTQVATSDLRDNIVESITSTLSLTQSIEHNQKFGEAESPLSLAQTTDQHGPLPRAASSTLDFDHNAHAAEEYEVSASQSLTITQTVVNSGTLPVAAASELELLSSADAGNDKNRSAESTLALTSDAAGFAAKSASSVLSLLQEAIGFTTQRLSSEISLTQTIVVRRPIYVDASDALVEYTEEFDPDTLEFVTTQTGLTGVASCSIRKSPSPHHYIQWTHSANGYADRASGIVETVTSTLSLTQVAQLSNPQDAENELTVSQTAAAQVSEYNPETTLSLAQAAVSAIVRSSIAASSVIGLQQATRYVVSKSSVTCEYSPFIGSTTDPDAPTPPSVDLPAVSELTGVRLLYPPTGTPTDTVVLRSPNFGDIDRLSFDRINRQTRGGTLKIFADPIWPKIETLLLTFSVLTRDEADDLLSFMKTTLGKEIRFIDWENRAWTGVIVNPQDPIVEDRRNSFTASFEFEGVRQTDRNFSVATSSALSLGQSAVGTGASRESLISFLNLDSVAASAADLNRSLSSPITLSDEALNNRDADRSESQTLTITDVAAQLSVRPRSLTSTLSLTSAASCQYLQPLRTGDGEILLTGDGDPLEYR